ncbi:MAG: ATP-binding protein [Acidobacteriaceae bacterium]|nr:ATP-binding protein [Acidobacteriaceae bacterium]
MVQIRKAERRRAKLRLALLGPTGSGKTYSALQLAFGLGGKVGMIDTENGSGDLYANVGDYDIITLEPPYTVQKYREAIRAFEEAEYDTVIIDSLTHAWSGEGGLLDKSSQLEKSGRVKNSFAAWREITPEHNKLVEEMLGSPCHIIGTMRVKTEYVLETNEKGKMVPRKVGLAPVQRDGLEYEFTVVMDVDASHVASASKDRTGMFDGWYDKISPETGKKLMAWLNTGRESAPVTMEAPKKRFRDTLAEWCDKAATLDNLAAIESHERVQHAMRAAGDDAKAEMQAMIAAARARLTPTQDEEAA